jgi:hypothetical protein
MTHDLLNPRHALGCEGGFRLYEATLVSDSFPASRPGNLMRIIEVEA